MGINEQIESEPKFANYIFGSVTPYLILNTYIYLWITITIQERNGINIVKESNFWDFIILSNFHVAFQYLDES